MRGSIEIVHSDAAQAWHVRLAAQSAEPLSASEQLSRHSTAVDNVLAQARTFGYDSPRYERLNGTTGLLWSGLTISGKPVLAYDVVIATVTIVDEAPS